MYIPVQVSESVLLWDFVDDDNVDQSWLWQPETTERTLSKITTEYGEVGVPGQS